jgi:hypothetical protein
MTTYWQGHLPAFHIDTRMRGLRGNDKSQNKFEHHSMIFNASFLKTVQDP